MNAVQEKAYLRELAKEYLDIANLPVMDERTELWYSHNALKSSRPIVVMEMQTFEHELLPPLKCSTEFGKRIEKEFLRHIVNHLMVDDDKVVPKHFNLEMDIRIRPFDIDIKREYAEDSAGRKLGYKDTHFIIDIEQDMNKLNPSVVAIDYEKIDHYEDYIKDMIGDLMPVQRKNKSLEWFCAPSMHIINLMGMEAFFCALYDSPEHVKALYEFICDDIIAMIRTMEAQRVLTSNCGNDYAGSGSYGFTNELPPTGDITSGMLWGNLNSQETVGVSPKMFEEFVFPAYKRLADEFGLVYYGCCEPVHEIWYGCLSELPNLRKVSISPWCDENVMGEALSGSKVIYSRKPSPNFIGVGDRLDEGAYREHIAQSLQLAKECTVELIHRDIYTLGGNNFKAKRAVEIQREVIDRVW